MRFDTIQTKRYRVIPMDGNGCLKLGYIAKGTDHTIAEEDHVGFKTRDDYNNFMTELREAKKVSDEKADEVIVRLERKLPVQWEITEPVC